MRRSFLFLLGVSIVAVIPAGTLSAKDSCYECHQVAGDKPTAQFAGDIHHRKGISCAGCHGGNPNTDDMDQAMSKAAGFIGVPKGDAISKICAACHGSPEKMKAFGSTLPTNQWASLQASAHANLPVAGRGNLVQCTTCHNAHGIVSVKNPASPVYPLNAVNTCARCHSDAVLMRSYNPLLPVDQMEKYRTSVHGMRNAKGDPKTAECASCHGSHDIRPVKDVLAKVYPTNIPGTCAACHASKEYMKPYGIPTDQFEQYTKSVHGVALLQKHDAGAPACNSCHGNHGAAPPGIASVSNVCGTCHALNAELFSTSPHKKAFDDRKLPECETCHGKHNIAVVSDTLLGVSSESMCGRCHTKSSGGPGYRVAEDMHAMTDSLVSAECTDIRLVDDAEQKGMEISEAKFKLRDVRQARLQARTMVHAFNEQKFRDAVKPGFETAGVIESEANAAIKEYYFRRIGLAVATCIITLLASALYLLVRRMEKKAGPGTKL